MFLKACGCGGLPALSAEAFKEPRMGLESYRNRAKVGTKAAAAIADLRQCSNMVSTRGNAA
jgi:hypothetical protein